MRDGQAPEKQKSGKEGERIERECKGCRTLVAAQEEGKGRGGGEGTVRSKPLTSVIRLS